MLRAVLVVSLLAGCGGDEVPIAAVTDSASAEDTTAEDTTPEETAAETSQLFGNCAADKDCEGDNAVCITAFPGGLCSHRCEGTGECSIAGRLGKCVANVCLPSCAPGSDCKGYSGGCMQRVSAIPLTLSNYCAPACYPSERAPEGYAKCIKGTVCEPQTNRCVVAAGASGAANGSACRDPEQCIGGDCQVDADGYPGGYCRSLGLLLDASAFGPGKPLPQSTCPAGSVVTPMHGGGVRTGSFTWCWKSCTATAECRTGYTCRFIDGSSTGYCGPADCRVDFACPTDHICAGEKCSK